MLTSYAPEKDAIDRGVYGTRERILLTAIRLFAAHGFHGVSLRAINDQAGAKNGSAVQYHFGNKFGLIQAVVAFIGDEMLPESRLRLRQLANRVGAAAPSVREVVEAAFGPPLAYSLRPGIGIAAAQILPLLVQDADPKIRQLFQALMREIIDQADRLLQRVLPHKPANVLRLQLDFALVNAVHLVTDLHVLYGADAAITDRKLLVKVYDHFLDFIAAGLSGERRGSERFRAELLAKTST